MPICRICGQELFEEPLIRFENMPKSAQFLPSAVSLGSDAGIELEVNQCAACGLVQLSVAPVHYYREVIRASGISEEMKSFRLKQFQGLVKNFFLDGKKIIEIGCGCGEYLRIMDQLDVFAYGLEYSEQSVKHCAENGLKVARGFIENEACTIAGGPFDAFYMLSFLEHLPDPNATLRGIYNNLTEDGLGMVEVPNFDMILKKNLFSEFISDHLFYFTKETLARTLNNCGFEVVECKEVWHDYILSAIVKKRKPLDISHFSRCHTQIKRELAEYIAGFANQTVAIWGAGHQALAIISLAELSGKIKYVVDSAPFKQGKFTPATHIPIVPPDRLAQDPVDAIIIIAGSYSEEVKRILRKNFDPHMKIAILRDNKLEQA